MEEIIICVCNIPSKLRSCDLRTFFSDFIESGKFVIFHYLHRKQTLQIKQSSADSKDCCCCFIKVPDEQTWVELKQRYHGKNWRDHKGEILPSLCYLHKVSSQVAIAAFHEPKQQQYLTNRQKKEMKKRGCTTNGSGMNILQEFLPPSGLPNGNVGTPLRTIHEQIQQCVLPPIALKKLGIELHNLRPYRRYGEVPLDYNQEVYHEESVEDDTFDGTQDETLTNVHNTTQYEHSTTNFQTTTKDEQDDDDIEAKYQNPPQEESSSDSEHGAEEWERHEAFQDSDGECRNPKDRQRDSSACTSKNYLYEEELEITWDKGGSGLVFYTDNAFWDQQRGDMDERDADSFDVDTSKYYDKEEPFSASEDEVETHSMRRKRKRGMIQDEDAPWNNLPIGYFEKYNNGIAGRIMKKFGWRKGQGMGPKADGIPLPIALPFQRGTKGLGYLQNMKEAAERNTPSPERNKKWVTIQSIYDLQREQERKDKEKNRTNSFQMPVATQEAVTFVSMGFLSNDLDE